jgi:hypothetical protein
VTLTKVEYRGVQDVDTDDVTQTGSTTVSFIEVDRIDRVVPLEGDLYPALVRVWDNDDDAIYDQV